MQRRAFLKSLAGISALGAIPTVTFSPVFMRSAHAVAQQFDAVDFMLPNVRGGVGLPQVINVFLYGGPSELAGNLTNIDEINGQSLNPYPASLLKTTAAGGQITANNLWANAGGNIMEALVANGHMSIYRTIHRRMNDTKAHRPSVFSSQKGSLNIDMAPGIGAVLAMLLYRNDAAVQERTGKSIEDFLLPFVTFEGETVAFAEGPNLTLPSRLKSLALDEDLNNPYVRLDDTNVRKQAIEALAQEMMVKGNGAKRYEKVFNALKGRAEMAQFVAGFGNANAQQLPVIPPSRITNAGLVANPDFDPRWVDESGRLRYPVNEYTNRIRAAVSLAIENPESLYITVGGDLGGWDDHNDALGRYVTRMQALFEAIHAAALQLRYTTRNSHGARDTSNIIINIHGDFGRNVNLNVSMGWDHGNNQNLYTLGGRGVRGQAALGKIVGSTEVYGSGARNRLFTRPTDDSYEAEPLAIASSVYQWFGAQNPEVLTRDANFNQAGTPAIDESVAGLSLASA